MSLDDASQYSYSIFFSFSVITESSILLVVVDVVSVAAAASVVLGWGFLFVYFCFVSSNRHHDRLFISMVSHFQAFSEFTGQTNQSPDTELK